MDGQTKKAIFEAINPIGELELEPEHLGINPRLDTLNGKMIGLFDNAKRSNPFVLGKIEKLPQERFPAIMISWFKKNTFKEVLWDLEKEWAKDLDGIIGMFGD